MRRIIVYVLPIREVLGPVDLPKLPVDLPKLQALASASGRLLMDFQFLGGTNGIAVLSSFAFVLGGHAAVAGAQSLAQASGRVRLVGVWCGA